MVSLSRVSGFSIELFKQLCRLRQAQALPHFAFSFAHLLQISQFYLLMFILRFSWAILSYCSEESCSSFSDYVYFLWLHFLFNLKVIEWTLPGLFHSSALTAVIRLHCV